MARDFWRQIDQERFMARHFRRENPDEKSESPEGALVALWGARPPRHPLNPTPHNFSRSACSGPQSETEPDQNPDSERETQATRIKNKTNHLTHSALQFTHYTLHTTHYTLHSTHYTLHTTHYTPHTCTLENTHYTLHNTHYTPHTTH